MALAVLRVSSSNMRVARALSEREEMGTVFLLMGYLL
jgi:energy-converting hydrogenase Eha subunit C